MGRNTNQHAAVGNQISEAFKHMAEGMRRLQAGVEQLTNVCSDVKTERA